MSSAAVPRPAAPGPWARIQDLILPVAMVASILVILVPVPAGLMDLLLAANITIAVMMLLTTLTCERRWSSTSFLRSCWPPRCSGWCSMWPRRD